MIVFKWRRVPESNRCTRICNPLRHHSANSPSALSPRSLWCGAGSSVIHFQAQGQTCIPRQSWTALVPSSGQAPAKVQPFRRNLWIFPVSVLGSALVKTTERGYL